MKPPLALAPPLVSRAFPFYVAVDRDLRLVSWGRSLQRLFPDVEAGTALTALARIRRPTLDLTYDALRQGVGRLMILELTASAERPLLLRGELVVLQDAEQLLFLGSPWLTEAEALGAMGLTINDFALHDGSADMIHVLRTQQIALQDTAALAQQLEEQFSVLEQTTSRLEALIQGLHYAVLVEDETRHIALVNQAFCDMFAIPAPPEALVGTDCSQAAEQSKAMFRDPDAFVTSVERALAERKTEEGIVLPLADGRVFVRDYVPIFVGEAYRGHLWQYRDITAATRAEADLQASEAIKGATLQAALDAIITIDESSIIREWNPAAERTFGWSRAEVVGSPLVETIIPEELRDAHSQGLQRLRETGEGKILDQRLELPGIRKDGTRIDVEFAVTRIPSPKGALFTGFLRDISARVQAGEELRAARAAAEAASDAKSRFLATMSHEMRTPLNAILGMAELAGETDDGEERAALLAIVRRNGHTLQRLIDDLLDISRIESGALRFHEEPVDLRELVDSVVELLAPRAAERTVQLTATHDPELYRYVRVDGHRLRQVLLNLIGNAVKFTTEGAVRVELAAESAPQGSVAFRITVRDTGIGIPEEALAQIFDRFYQVDSSDRRRFGGSGLGLAITRSLVERMGGRIEVRSEPGAGTTFDVYLTLERSGPTSTPSSSSVSGLKLKGTVLVAEDQPDSRALLERYLTIAGAHVVGVEDGEAAVARYRSGGIDVVLMDVQMPRVDGLEATRRIREIEREEGGLGFRSSV